MVTRPLIYPTPPHLVWTGLIAVLLHVIVLLGVRFAPPPAPPSTPPLLRVTLGAREQAVQAQGMVAAPTEFTADQDMPPPLQPIPALLHTVETAPAAELPPSVSTEAPNVRPSVAVIDTPPPIAPTPAPKPAVKAPVQLVAKKPDAPPTPQKVITTQSNVAAAAFPPRSPSPPPAPSSKPIAIPPTPPPAPAESRDLRTRALQLARSERLADIPTEGARHKRLIPNQMTTVERFYVETWRRKVEQVGTLNFPEIARKLGVKTGPTLDVALRSDGRVEHITIVRSSGHPELDEAARRIVHQAAPYAPFPDELRRQVDILHIVRRWHFKQGQLVGQ